MLEDRREAFDQSPENELALEALSALSPGVSTPIVPPANPGFELPRALWVGMLACYAVFFAAIFAATGGSGHCVFAIVVSILYTAMYFGVARLAVRQAGREDVSPLERGRPLQTWTGPMNAKAVYGQILIVPAAVALFGIAILFIVALA